jgi:hypothetical protein
VRERGEQQILRDLDEIVSENWTIADVVRSTFSADAWDLARKLLEIRSCRAPTSLGLQKTIHPGQMSRRCL